MNQLINNEKQRKELLKHMILQLHKGTAPEVVRRQLSDLLGQVPYDTVVEVEQELISEGLPMEEVLKLCDVHSAVLKGKIDQSGAKSVPEGHPVHTFQQENHALQVEIAALNALFNQVEKLTEQEMVPHVVNDIAGHFNNLLEVDKHYRRKEYLLFPHLEKHGITGPPTVMWGKHDEARELLKAGRESLSQVKEGEAGILQALLPLALKPAVDAVEEMFYKEEQILFPMCLDTLSEEEWSEVYNGSFEIGYCLFAPKSSWQPSTSPVKKEQKDSGEIERINLPTGSFSLAELTAVLNMLPFDITFVDKDDTVRYYSAGSERIFERNLAVIGRKVQFCHPPNSVHIVQKILDDFRSGRENRAPFWINMDGKFIHIEYFALRDEKGDYLGTLEVTQDLTNKKQLTGDQRLLSYAKEGNHDK